MAQMTANSSLCRSGNDQDSATKIGFGVTNKRQRAGKFTNSEAQSSLPTSLGRVQCRPEAFLLGPPMAAWVAPYKGSGRRCTPRSSPSWKQAGRLRLERRI